jgi:hypothetical protein
MLFGEKLHKCFHGPLDFAEAEFGPCQNASWLIHCFGSLGMSQDCPGRKVTCVAINATFVTSKATSEVRRYAPDQPEGESNGRQWCPTGAGTAIFGTADILKR